MSGHFAFDFRCMRERLVPACLQFAGNKPVGRIGRVVLTESPVSGKARRFKIALERLAYLVPPLDGFRLCRNSGRNGAGADDGEKRIRDGVVDLQTAKGDAETGTLDETDLSFSACCSRSRNADKAAALT